MIGAHNKETVPDSLSSGDPDARCYSDTLQRILHLTRLTFFTVLRIRFSLRTCYFTALLGISSTIMEYVMF